MPPLQTLAVENRVLEFHKFTGEVVDEKIWSTTHVSSAGGGYNVGSGQHNPVSIASTSVTHNQFFLKSDTGAEMAVELSNSFAVRKGHRITVLWAAVQGTQQSSYIAAVNHSLNSFVTFPDAIQNLAAPQVTLFIIAAWTVSFFAICFYGLGFIALIVLFIIRRNLKKQLLASVHSTVDKLLADARAA